MPVLGRLKPWGWIRRQPYHRSWAISLTLLLVLTSVSYAADDKAEAHAVD